jgi:hypothetical protein
MCLNVSINSRDVSGANMLSISIENSDQDKEFVMIPVLLS